VKSTNTGRPSASAWRTRSGDHGSQTPAASPCLPGGAAAPAAPVAGPASGRCSAGHAQASVAAEQRQRDGAQNRPRASAASVG
jgi:hypothetical protein